MYRFLLTPRWIAFHLVVIAGQALTATLRHPGVANWASTHTVATRRVADIATTDPRNLALVI